MKAWLSGRISAAKTGWVIALLILGWVLFLFLPFGREENGEAPRTTSLRPEEAELTAVGLRYNVDWIGLPRYFAIWVDRIHWSGDETDFAYWNPGSRSYSYVFRATRAGGNYRFRLLSIEPAVHLASETVPESETHPFVFLSEAVQPPSNPIRSLASPPPAIPDLDIPHAVVDLPSARLEPPGKLEQEESINEARK